MKISLPVVLITILLGAFSLAACGGASQGSSGPSSGPAATSLPTPPPEYAGKTNPLQGNASAAQAGKQLFVSNCASCHGENARGNGPAASSLHPKPANLAALQNKMSDDYMFWRISEGGAMPPFNSAMPAWKGVLSEEQIWQIITYLRTLGP
jgi:mono/diheme cytochrome c family protein